MINKKLNINKLSKEFKEKKAIRIDNFFDEDFANKLNHFFTKVMPRDWWYLSTMPKRPDCIEVTDNVRLNGEHDSNTLITYKKAIAESAFQQGQFSYSFKRTIENHHESCICMECELRSFLKSPEAIKLINRITGAEIKEATQLFSSLYEEGDFLSIHHDGPNGKVGFVFNLCPGWKADWGGLLHTLDDDQQAVTKTYVPGFNTLTLFDSSQDTGYPHYVSHVLKTDAKRISFTGWYK
tara:strand:+ start:165 stop:878 length:714 start_codon:yes stop_codon:yes gene_type:complete